MNRSFSMDDKKTDFVRSYAASLTPYLIVAGTMVFQILSSRFTYKIEAAAGIVILILAAAAVVGVTQYRKYSNLRYIISERSIQVFDRNKGRVETLLFSELLDVKLPDTTDGKKKGRQTIRLTFHFKRKLVFSSMLPYFADLHRYLQQMLSLSPYPRISSQPAEPRTNTK
ncbi:hypothetical protein JXO52_11760 [bacterium]|nr:hypothetical protein [bacterium]